MPWFSRRSLPFLGLLLAAGALLAACAAPVPTVPNPHPRVTDWYQNRVLSAILWNPDPGPLNRLEIHLGENRLYGYQGNRLVAMTTVSAGRDGHDTPLGTFPVISKDKDHKSNEYGSFIDDVTGKTVDYNAGPKVTPPAGSHYVPAPMPFFLRLTDDGVGLHAGYVTGTRVSHGCIRMPETFAEDLFAVVPVGTPVTIIR